MALIWEWCGFCGAKYARTTEEIEQRITEPPCPRCGEVNWRSEAEEFLLDEEEE